MFTLNQMTKEKIIMGSDHAGFDLKQEIIKNFGGQFEFIDIGCNNSQDSVDYPDFANLAAEEIMQKQANFGILICGSGIGISIAANRHKNIRAALCHNLETAKLARQHNNANILCLGARTTKTQDALEMVKIFFQTEFLGGRHQRRVKKLGE